MNLGDIIGCVIRLRVRHVAPYVMVFDRLLLLYVVIKVVEYLDKLI